MKRQDEKQLPSYPAGSPAGGSIAALPAMAAGNIVDNGAFEADTASWESTGSNALSWEDTYADKNGVANIAANSDTSGDAHGIRQDLLSKGIKPASTYTFEADIYTLEPTNETATFNIYFLTSWTPNDYYNRPTASNIVAGGGMQLKPNQWNHVVYTLETPAEDSDLWKKVKGKLHGLTFRSRCGNIVRITEKIKMYMKEWPNYYGIAEMKNNIESLNG